MDGTRLTETPEMIHMVFDNQNTIARQRQA